MGIWFGEFRIRITVGGLSEEGILVVDCEIRKYISKGFLG